MKKLLLSIILISSISAFGQSALDFDGTDDAVNCGNLASVQISGTTITLEAWIYPLQWKTNVWEGNIINKESNSPDYGYMIRAGENGKLNFNIGNGFWNEITTPASTLTLNTWQHVAATYDGSTMKLFLDGVLVTSSPFTISISNANTQDLVIGNWSNYAGGSHRSFDGQIEDVRIWDITRSDSEIANYKDSCLSGSETGLVAYFLFDEGTGTNTADQTANANNGTLINMSNPAWVNGLICGQTTGLNENEFSDYSIYPNPFTDNITIDLGSEMSSQTTISLINIVGETVYKNTISNKKNVVNISLNEKLSKGIYFLQITSNDKKITKKLIKK